MNVCVLESAHTAVRGFEAKAHPKGVEFPGETGRVYIVGNQTSAFSALRR